MFGLTKREQRWKAEQKAAETLIPMITAITVEAMKQDDKDAEIERLRAQVAALEGDAARYRWLRDWASLSDWEYIGIQTDTNAAIDTAIDAARKGEA